MKLITEITEDVEYLTETSKDGSKKFFIEGPFLTANQANRNGRVYPGDVMESAVNKYNQEYVTTKRSVGELGHPDGPSINLDRVSHVIESLKHDGKDHWIGRAKILESTPMGKIAASLISEGIRLGVSSRGLGSLVDKNGTKYVQPDYFISTIDVVQDPSGPGCYVNGLMENVDYKMLDDGRIVQLVVDNAKKKINEQKFIKQFSQLIESFKK